MPNTRIILTGFMGSGKSTIGNLLAAHLHWAFHDLDREIEARTRLTVPEIFATHGESHFRDLETQTLADLVQRQNVVIALGGGAPEHAPTRAILTQTPDIALIYLDAAFDTLYDRCLRQSLDPGAVARPLLTTHAESAARHTRRHPLYAVLATHTVDTTHFTPGEAVNAILTALA